MVHFFARFYHGDFCFVYLYGIGKFMEPLFGFSHELSCDLDMTVDTDNERECWNQQKIRERSKFLDEFEHFIARLEALKYCRWSTS